MARKRRMTFRMNVALTIMLALVAAIAVLGFGDPHYRPPVRYRDDSPLQQRLDRWLHGRPGILRSDGPATVSAILNRSQPTGAAPSHVERPPSPPRP